MQLRDISFPTPQENIAFDEVLWLEAQKEGAGEYLRFWESSQIFIVMGLTGNEEADVDLEHVRRDRIPVLRRSSGGGTVLQGPGCLNYALILSKQKRPVLNDLHGSYEWISARLIEALWLCGVEAIFRPLSDLATGEQEKKFSGNAQRRGKNYILHHGTILYNFDISLISRYLQMPQDIPEYRKHRPHADFVTNVPLAPPEFKAHLSRIFEAQGTQSLKSEELVVLKKFLNN